MQTSAHFTATVQTTRGTPATAASALRELSLTELLAVSGGSPKGGWLAAGQGSTSVIELSSPKGGWQAAS